MLGSGYPELLSYCTLDAMDSALAARVGQNNL
jgi:hypothetical protein